jgi:hypothetical protein
MTDKAPKPHVLIAAEPHREGQDYATPCGVGVRKAGLLKSWTPESGIQMTDFRGTCWSCLKKITLAEFLRGRYVALALDGELLQMASYYFRRGKGWRNDERYKFDN